MARECKKCGKWFRSEDSWSNHYLYFCFNNSRIKFKSHYNDLDCLLDYLNNKKVC